MVQQALQDLFGVKLSLGSVNQLRQEASGAVVEAVAAQTYVQQQSVVGMDETSFVQGNQDGHNPQQQRLVVMVMTVGELLSRLAQPFSSCSKSVGPGV